MFFIIGCVLLGVVAIFLIAKKVAPQSEFMNSFTKGNSFRNLVVSLIVVAGLMFTLNYFVERNEIWRENAIIQIENDQGEIELFQGKKNEAAMAFNEQPKAKAKYDSSLLLWKNYENIKLTVIKKGNEEKQGFQTGIEGELTPFNNNTYTAPVSLYFEEAGIWKVIVKNNNETIGEIVFKVEE
ncbi:hypothetical protein [Rossellomorea aquimaris]|uniref:hypothetical protein n=1 Tax=Rossellomorea aquimaris TaxID=189382 RepID=UPI0007D0980E|nr:hypothetical protein [Rossellomorea aquimaris]